MDKISDENGIQIFCTFLNWERTCPVAAGQYLYSLLSSLKPKGASPEEMKASKVLLKTAIVFFTSFISLSGLF